MQRMLRRHRKGFCPSLILSIRRGAFTRSRRRACRRRATELASRRVIFALAWFGVVLVFIMISGLICQPVGPLYVR